MNWGHKITIGFIVFIVFILSMVYISMSTDFFLVEENYYEEEIAFQQKIDSELNGKSWSRDIKILEQADSILIIFEGASLVTEGKLHFFRPSNATLDFQLAILEEQRLDKAKIPIGKWIAKFTWTYEGRTYTREETLYLGS